MAHIRKNDISPAKCRYIKTARASSSQQVVVVVLVVLRGQWARSRGVLLLMAHIRNKLLAKNKNMLVCSVPIEGTVYTDPFRWASIRACSVTLFPIFADQKQFSCYRKYWRNEKDRNKSSKDIATACKHGHEFVSVCSSGTVFLMSSGIVHVTCFQWCDVYHTCCPRPLCELRLNTKEKKLF